MPAATAANQCGRILHEFREGVRRDAPQVGKCLRRADRIGRKVSQEEMAEVLGVSREWYVRLEKGQIGNVTREFTYQAASILDFPDLARARLLTLAFTREDFALRTGLWAAFTTMRKRIVAASTLEEAIERALEAIQVMVRPDYAGFTDRNTKGFQVGPIANTVNDTSKRIALDATTGIANGGLAVALHIPTIEELKAAHASKTKISGSRESGERLDYACSLDMWHEGCGLMRPRTSIHCAVKRDELPYGIISVIWRDDHVPSEYATSVVSTVTDIVNVLARSPIKSINSIAPT